MTFWRALGCGTLLATTAVQAADSPKRFVLQPLYQWAENASPEASFQVSPSTFRMGESVPEIMRRPAFFAVVSEDWPRGWMPVFAVERQGRVEFRRRPRSGWEAVSDPLFFGKPLNGETNAARICGRWLGEGIHADGRKESFGWDWTLDGGNVVGRFDPHTDYRFGNIVGGTIEGEGIGLKIEYIRNEYQLTGSWRNGEWRGRWDQLDEAGEGTWRAWRPGPAPEVDEGGLRAAALYVWRRESDGMEQLGPAEAGLPAGWLRTDAPLCLVWWAAPSTVTNDP